ncbi:hypothetical protein GCM10023195_60070 [Actinoallomurus liliacearum]|uniref:Uncharacterized protein n=1 Tax=Actinoallomurus liliacearum TaxID=1080073 RepID=A0ABP8TUB4_9ACTN
MIHSAVVVVSRSSVTIRGSMTLTIVASTMISETARLITTIPSQRRRPGEPVEDAGRGGAERKVMEGFQIGLFDPEWFGVKPTPDFPDPLRAPHGDLTARLLRWPSAP